MDRLAACASAASLTGIFLIYFFSLGFEPDDVEISDIGNEMKGKTVRIEGAVKSVRQHDDGHVFVAVSDGGSEIQVPIFSDVARAAPDIRTGDRIRVVGYVDGYKGRVQIVPKNARNIELVQARRQPGLQ
ncbi:MAG: exodeoxyribonuclease VII large subunit [Candidatus Aenigmarchaeota archaeon]|nr:exodeoxyribonuclease VII large subunit [Candidatus Aenigmarchaeota archaeon]